MRASLGLRIALTGGMVAIVASLAGPFRHIGDISTRGVDSGHNGVIIIVLTLLALAAVSAGLARGDRNLTMFAFILSCLALLVTVLDFNDVSAARDSLGALGSDVAINRGWGLYLATLGSFGLVAGTLFATVNGRRDPG